MPNELQITEAAWNKMFGWARAAYKLEGAECVWLLQIEELPDGGLLVEDVVLPDQESTACHTEAKQSGPWLKGIKLDQAVKFKGWGHSHHNMSTFYSGTDDNTLSDKWDGESKNCNHYAVGLVLAFPNLMKAWIVYYRPIATTKIELPIKVLMPDSPDPLAPTYEAQVKERLKKKVWEYTQTLIGKGAYGTGHSQTATKEIRSELPEPPTGAGEDEDDDWEGGELLDPKQWVIDGISGLTVAQLEEQGLWDPAYYPDLVAQLAHFDRNFIRRPKNQKDERTCLRQYYNKRGKLVCGEHGKHPDCESCKIGLPITPELKDVSKSPSSPATPKQETASEKTEEVGSAVEPISSPALHKHHPIEKCGKCGHYICICKELKKPLVPPESPTKFCGLYPKEPETICPVLGQCHGCPHADTVENRAKFSPPKKEAEPVKAPEALPAPTYGSPVP